VYDIDGSPTTSRAHREGEREKIPFWPEVAMEEVFTNLALKKRL